MSVVKSGPGNIRPLSRSVSPQVSVWMHAFVSDEPRELVRNYVEFHSKPGQQYEAESVADQRGGPESWSCHSCMTLRVLSDAIHFSGLCVV